MGKYLLKRLGQSIIAILGITVVVFFILHLTGNPVELMVSPIMLFAVKLGWMPTGGAEDGLRSLILPAFTLGVFSAATICRLLRSNLIEVLGKEYIDVAKAKGLPKSKIIGKHALKNAMSSIITILGMQFASLLGGSVITEQVFAWPGVGRLVIQSITTSDFAVVECIVFLMAVIFVVINFIVDVLYCVINPRVRLQ